MPACARSRVSDVAVPPDSDRALGFTTFSESDTFTLSTLVMHSNEVLPDFRASLDPTKDAFAVGQPELAHKKLTLPDRPHPRYARHPRSGTNRLTATPVSWPALDRLGKVIAYVQSTPSARETPFSLKVYNRESRQYTAFGTRHMTSRTSGISGGGSA